MNIGVISSFQGIIIATLMSLVLGCPGDDHKCLLTLERELFNWRITDRPDFASNIGHYRNSDRLEHFGLEYMITRYEIAMNYLGQLRSIDVTKLSSRDSVDYAILEDMLETYVHGFEWREWNYLTPMTWLEGPQRDPVFFVESTPFDNRGDFENYIARLIEMPRLFKEYTELFRAAISLNRTAHRVSVSRVPEQIDYILEIQNPQYSIYFLPIEENLNHTYFKDTIPNYVRQDMLARGKKASAALIRAYKGINDFIKNEYMKHTRPQVGIGSIPGGKDYYKACLKWYLSLDVTPEDIHEKGKSEVNRVKNEMRKIMAKQGYGPKHKIRSYFTDLKNRKDMFFETEEEIIHEYENMIERIEPHLKSLFHDPPGLPIKVDVMRSDGSRGEYMAGTPDGIRPGIFFVNTFRKWPKYTMISTAMHETNPGHHLQMSYAASADLQEFRKMKEFSDIFRVPFSFPSYTAYVEGWALYSESLGIETHIYRDDYERMGYYEAEMWRACRMVADTGMHYFGWTRDQAINLFLDHTSETREGIEIEVDRYITWPGQAVAYKIGEIKIKELRKFAEENLGEHFDIRDFHRVVLANGGMPLDLLSKIVKEWVHNFQKERESGEEEMDECDCSTSKTSQGKSRCSRSLNGRKFQAKPNNLSWHNRPGLGFILCVLVSIVSSMCFSCPIL